jgi:hypothetical protein
MGARSALGPSVVTWAALTSGSLLAAAIVYGLLLQLASGAGLFGIPLAILVLLSIWRYGYAVLRSIAQGRTEIAAAGLETMNPVGELPVILHFVLFASAAFFFATTPLFGDSSVATAFRWVALAIVVGTFPASAALVAFGGNAGAALHPAHVGGVIGTLGRGYLKLLAAACAVSLFTNLVVGVVLPNLLVELLGAAVAVWGWLTVFALIGAALHEHREELDIPGARKTRDQWARIDREHVRQQTVDRAYGSIRSGLVAEGYRTLRELVSAEHDSLEIHEWLYGKLLTWEDPAHALQIAGRLIDELLAANRAHEALDVVCECRRLSRDFAVSPESAARLAEYARAIGRHAIADELAEVTPRPRHP